MLCFVSVKARLLCPGVDISSSCSRDPSHTRSLLLVDCMPNASALTTQQSQRVQAVLLYQYTCAMWHVGSHVGLFRSIPEYVLTEDHSLFT